MFGSPGNFESSLFDEFRRMERQMDALFGRGVSPVSIRASMRGSFPPVNVGATPEKVDVYLFAAGLDPKSLDITIQKNLLTIAGQRMVEPEDNAKYYRQERFSGEFRRAVSLPDDVDPERVDARYKDGVLHISVLRREAVKPRQVEVK